MVVRCSEVELGGCRLSSSLSVPCPVVSQFFGIDKNTEKNVGLCWFMLVYVGFGFPTSSFCPYAICAIQVSYMKELYDKTYILSGERLGRIMVQSVQDQGAAAALTSCAGSGSIADHSMEYGNGMDMVK